MAYLNGDKGNREKHSSPDLYCIQNIRISFSLQSYLYWYFKFNKKKYGIMKKEMPSQKNIFGSNGAR